MTFVRVGGVPHHVQVTGSGPVCVLSAGLGLGWFDWDPVVPLLAPHRTVVRFDRPGLGLSGHARVAPSLRGEAERVLRVLDAVGPGAARATVVGHSLAGFHMEAFARLYPQRTSGLVLVDSSVEERPRVRVPRGARVAGTRACGAFLCATGVPRAVGPALRRLAAPTPWAGVYGSGRVWRAALLEYMTYGDVAVELAELRRAAPLPGGVPVTVLAAYAGGSGEWLARQRGLAARLGGTCRIAAPSGHLVMRDRPADVAAAILAARS
ncbi:MULTISPECIES: alpha/beta fold hydrolase [Streptomyces]|uniref:alpha/beta fold hydrolase n=1 Tax=Streptomyces TaxID=1883 RepID=UPI001E583480|nr:MULTISPECIES: alpha/beta hydrolase [Streptomyces]UFQ20142.1 alpha/beta hydrolase [Streptomyces huasconensis]WCL89759.1 alpha/beta hydrolase [Streptomyces sp. JCM 35825]